MFSKVLRGRRPGHRASSELMSTRWLYSRGCADRPQRCPNPRKAARCPRNGLHEPRGLRLFTIVSALVDDAELAGTTWLGACEAAYPKVYRGLVAMGASAEGAADALQ